ncbi:antibiotic biosynthesis monooxygenase family protein [Ottowia sp. VDI28]|uniref:antibiotic biosynthesis monooxygenase family protein n=1 Tax=Ottowia sp. VDI28 TaxID=3133968 RepID=UPI003C307CCE
MSPFALNLKPPYYAVIFASQRTEGDDGYAATAQHMAELAARQPGYLGAESTRDEAGFGITVAYYDSLEAIAAWRRHAEHTLAREQGRERWYQHFEVRIAKVERAYSFDRGAVS